jgi:hypothetical protein
MTLDNSADVMALAVMSSITLSRLFIF